MKNNNTAWSKTRKFLNDVHLWVGLASGLIVFLVCLSGTIYVFNNEIREAATPELFKVSANNGQKVAAAQMIAAVEKASKGKVVSVKIPAAADRSWQLGVKKSSRLVGDVGAKGNGNREKPLQESKGEGNRDGKKGENKKGGPEKGAARPTIYYVNPYNGAILGNSADIKSGTVTFMTYMFSLHRWLILDKIEKPIFGELENRKLGSYITGTATILFTLGVLTGMVIWFPRKIRSWKQGLKIKWSANWKRINHDLHNSLGLYACVFLFLMGITGPQWSFEWYRTGLKKSLGTYKPENGGKSENGDRPENGAKPGDGTKAEPEVSAGDVQKPIVEDYLLAANQVFKFKGDIMISLPAEAGAEVNVNKFKAGFFAPAAADRLTLDQYTKQVIKVERFADMPFNERASASIKAVHVGDVYGMFTKIIYFLACLIATSLPVTGTLIWINKMKKKKPENTAIPTIKTPGQVITT